MIIPHIIQQSNTVFCLIIIMFPVLCQAINVKNAHKKLKKQGDGALTLTFVPTPDVAKAVGEGKRDGQILVGFAAETETAVENARKKLDSKHLDMIVANDVTQPGAGFDVDTNIATIITHQQAESLPIMTKKALADEILTRALALRG